MKNNIRILITSAAICLIGIPQVSGQMTKTKKAVIASVDAQSEAYIKLSDKIWALAETALEETESARALSNFAETQGFTVTRGIAGMPTAFIAEYGDGKPIIGILGEYDALPGLSQKAEPTKNPLNHGAAGHGCGHNLFGVGSMAAAIAIKEQIVNGKLDGTVRFYGTPAEETIFGKLWIARDGFLDDLDVCFDWHPSAEIAAAVQSSKALIDFIVEFHGQAAHASADPWNGRSALDGLEFFTNGLNYAREHLKPTARIHYQIQRGGDVVNVVPDYARIWTRLRDSKHDDVLKHYERAKQIVEGAAMMANVDYEISLISGLHEIIPNRTGGKKMQANLELLGPIRYNESEIAYAHIIQTNTDKEHMGIDGAIHPLKETREHPQGGSTDVGDVSWIVPWHSWAVVACGGMSIGHKGMIYAAKALAMTMVDVFEDEKLRNEIRAEYVKRRGDSKYEAILPDGPPPDPKELSGKN